LDLSADPELGLVYLPVEMPSADYNGYNRPGDGLFGESLVAVDVKTGQRKWHYQTVHHGLWDYDLRVSGRAGGGGLNFLSAFLTRFLLPR
jgi:glucose dehydrogenase